MSIPAWHQFMSTALRVLLDGEVRTRRDIIELVAEHVGLSSDDRVPLMASGQPVYEARIGWALEELARSGSLERPSRARYRITPLGRELLSAYPQDISEKLAREWYRKAAGGDLEPEPGGSAGSTVGSELNPVEQVEKGVARLHSTVASDLLARLHGQHPTFFEKVVVDLLIAMGYGGAGGRETVTQASNDGGIDGVIDQDALGLNRVYVQAKRYALDSSVGRPEVQAFVGALSGRADGGVFITTARFSSGAQDYARTAHSRIILIDGARLASLMIRYGVGVQVKQTLHIVEVDEDFFE